MLTSFHTTFSRYRQHLPKNDKATLVAEKKEGGSISLGGTTNSVAGNWRAAWQAYQQIQLRKLVVPINRNTINQAIPETQLDTLEAAGIVSTDVYTHR
jgi:hypothetical protein